MYCNALGTIQPNNHTNPQQYDDLLAIYAMFAILPCDVGVENLPIGADQRMISSSIWRIPFSRISLYRFAQEGVFNILRPDQE
tara:strand:- start:5047 stop:5295 length:249 start_codon:yes stop_codon:yes gene_type:complete